MSAAVRATPLTVLACAMVIAGELLIMKGMYDWTNRPRDVTGQPPQGDRVVVYLAALLVAAGAAVFAVSGARGPALAVLATAIVPVLLILPGYHTMNFYPSLIMVTVGVAMALRTMLAPGIPVTLVSVLGFFMIAAAGSFLLRGLVDAVPPLDWGTEEEARMRANGRLVCGLAGLALLPAPLLWLATGHRWLAALSAPFLLVAAFPLIARNSALGWFVFAITGPMALGGAIYALFADR
ncbi:hypothetical protein [Actinomadura sp. 7K507]|uniref:hypothetical protein n=1 Tax=Actinomadura sp. 7K507 TaxID=2530365 RepID=UPI0010464F41|nr:hypothetical protein [Actinomadura sp. 7K507]TDC89146.1 hypothetical protein E1285_17020 [Actinomadura sp. 7K507]